MYAGVSSQGPAKCALCSSRVMALLAHGLMLPELAKVQPIQAEIARPRQYIHLHPCTHHTFKLKLGSQYLGVAWPTRAGRHAAAAKEVGDSLAAC